MLPRLPLRPLPPRMLDDCILTRRGFFKSESRCFNSSLSRFNFSWASFVSPVNFIFAIIVIYFRKTAHQIFDIIVHVFKILFDEYGLAPTAMQFCQAMAQPIRNRRFIKRVTLSQHDVLQTEGQGKGMKPVSLSTNIDSISLASALIVGCV